MKFKLRLYFNLETVVLKLLNISQNKLSCYRIS